MNMQMNMLSYSEQFDELSRQMRELGSGLECHKAEEIRGGQEAMVFVISDTTSEPRSDFARYAELA